MFSSLRMWLVTNRLVCAPPMVSWRWWIEQFIIWFRVLNKFIHDSTLCEGSKFLNVLQFVVMSVFNLLVDVCCSIYLPIVYSFDVGNLLCLCLMFFVYVFMSDVSLSMFMSDAFVSSYIWWSSSLFCLLLPWCFCVFSVFNLLVDVFSFFHKSIYFVFGSLLCICLMLVLCLCLYLMFLCLCLWLLCLLEFCCLYMMFTSGHASLRSAFGVTCNCWAVTTEFYYAQLLHIFYILTIFFVNFGTPKPQPLPLSQAHVHKITDLNKVPFKSTISEDHERN